MQLFPEVFAWITDRGLGAARGDAGGMAVSRCPLAGLHKIAKMIRTPRPSLSIFLVALLRHKGFRKGVHTMIEIGPQMDNIQLVDARQVDIHEMSGY